MTKTLYCNEGQATASVTVDGITYKTDNPPLSIEDSTILAGYKESRWKVFIYETSSFQLIGGTYTNSSFGYTLYRDAIGESQPRPWAIRRSDTGAIIYQIESYLGIPEEEIISQSTEQQNVIKVTDGGGSTLITFPSGIPYDINCDGCGVGECKGDKARYPGYDCLDCAKLQRQLKSIGNRIDGITKR